MDHDHLEIVCSPAPRRLHTKFEQHWPQRFQRRSHLKLSTFFPYKRMGPIQMHMEANLFSLQKSQTLMYNNHFSNFGRPPIPDYLCKDSAQRPPRFWRRRIFKGFYHIWAWWPSWSMNRDHFSNLSLPQAKEAPHKIWTTLTQRFQRRSHLKFSTFFPYKCMVPIQMHREANLISPYKGQTSMYNNYLSNFGRPLVPDDLCKDSAQRHPRFWRRRFLKVFIIYGHGGHLGQWSAIILALFHYPT